MGWGSGQGWDGMETGLETGWDEMGMRTGWDGMGMRMEWGSLTEMDLVGNRG